MLEGGVEIKMKFPCVLTLTQITHSQELLPNINKDVNLQTEDQYLDKCGT